MKTTLVVLAAAISITTTTCATPLVSHSIRSNAGWYSWGCYEDCGGASGMDRFLPYQAYANATNSDPDMCISACQAAGYAFAGVQWGEECWCGNGLNGAPKAPAEQCNMAW